MTLPLLLLIGFIAGIASGMFGIGGGLIIVPALMLLANFTQVEANGTSLAVLLLPVGILAVLAYVRAKMIHIPTALWIALGLMIGSLAGAHLALSLPASLLKQIYGIFLLVMGWRFAEIGSFFKPTQAAKDDNSNRNNASHPPLPILLAIGLGILAGVASGMFGIGGGAVIVPVLAGFLKYDQKSAIGTSLGALLLPVGLPGVLLYAKAGHLSLSTAAPVALGVLLGAIFGARITISLPTSTVKRLYGFFLILLALKFIFF